jgi:mannose-6-phosphate isomerase-like protein (cupin superfamily)
MQAFEWSELLAERGRVGGPWLEFLRAATLSMGVYHLRAGEEDRQRPHTEDEVYYVVAGRARFRAGEEDREVQPGTLLFVPRLVEHRFLDVAADLSVLVFFAPAEGSLRGEGNAAGP